MADFPIGAGDKKIGLGKVVSGSDPGSFDASELGKSLHAWLKDHPMSETANWVQITLGPPEDVPGKPGLKERKAILPPELADADMRVRVLWREPDEGQVRRVLIQSKTRADNSDGTSDTKRPLKQDIRQDPVTPEILALLTRGELKG